MRNPDQSDTMVEPMQGLRERNRIRTKTDILDAVGAALGEMAYGALTLDLVAQRAGLSRKTIYSYFPDGRDQMVREAYLRQAERVAQAGSSAREALHDPSERILALVDALIQTVVTPEGRFYGAMGPDVSAMLTTVGGGTSSSFRAMIRQDLESALVKRRVDAYPLEQMAEVLTGTVRSAGNAAARRPETADQVREAMRLIIEGLLGSIGGADPRTS